MSSVEDVDKIDLISYDEENNVVKLFMNEGRDWDSDNEMYLQLQEKLSTYLTFIEGGMMESEFPEYIGATIEVHLDCVDEPKNQSLSMLDRVRKLLLEKNINFFYHVINI